MRAAIYQSETSGLMPSDRLERLEWAAREAEADLLLCPELFLSGYAAEEDVRRHAEPADGPFAAAVARIAQTTATAIVYGYPERAQERLYNAAQCIDATGRRLANHHKLVLPPGYESDCFTPGNGVSVFELNGVKLALLICYDAEFPETVRACAEAGAEMLLVPTALGAQWSVVARQVIPARAFENGVYLLYANHAGAEGDLHYLGESCIVAPDGSDRARSGRAEEVIAAELDLSLVSAAQARLPYHRDVVTLRERLK